VAELSAAATLDDKLHPHTASNLADLVRIMNTYYSNLIEGHNTRPRDIERALVGLLGELADQGVNVRIESQIAEGLHLQDKGGLAVRGHHLEAGLEECGNQGAEFDDVSATMAEERTDQFRQSENILPVWNRREHVILQPLAVGEHALLMTARTEVASLAGIGQKVVKAALIAVDAREPLNEGHRNRESVRGPPPRPTGGPARPHRVHRCVVIHTLA
jgi:hypothetical protein